MPYPNEHAVRLLNPELFITSSFRRKNISEGIDIILGRLKTDPKNMTIQAYRFRKNKFTISQVNEFLTNNKINYISIEEASKDQNGNEEYPYKVCKECEGCENMDGCKIKDTKENKVNRIDVMEFCISNNTESFTQTKEGFFTGRSIVTNIGVFPYRQNDGVVIWELRTPEEVFNEDSLNTLKLKPITNEHPIEMVDVTNVKELSVGMTGDSCYNDSYCVSIPITITDAKTIIDVKNGKQSLSCGYTADMEYKAGVWMGVPYQAIQRNIRYNHIAIVDNGRAGDLAKIKMDTGIYINENNLIVNQDGKKDGKKEGAEMSEILKKMTLDGIEYQAESEVIKAYNLLKNDMAKNLEDSKVNLAKLEAERDSLKEKFDTAEKKIVALETAKLDENKINELVAKKMDLISKALKFGVEVKSDMLEIDIMKAVIVKDSANVNLEGKNEIYIQARFDGAIENLESKIDATNKEVVLGGDVKVPEAKTDSNDARAKYIESLKNDYKNGGK